MPLFATFDSVHTETASETLPELSLSLHEEASSDVGFTSFHLVDRETLGVHDHLTGFVIPDMVETTEMGFDVLNPADSWYHDTGSAHDPAMELEVLTDIFDAITDSYINGHHEDSAGASKWDKGWIQNGDKPEHTWHKHNEDGSTSVAKSNPTESSEYVPIYIRVDGETVGRDHDEENRLWGDSEVVQQATTDFYGNVIDDLFDSLDNDITPDSEGGGARIVAIESMIHEAYNQQTIENHINQNLIGESMSQNHLFAIDTFPVDEMSPQHSLENNFTGMDMSSYLM